MVTLLLPRRPLAFHSIPMISSVFFAWAPLSYLEMLSVNKGNHSLLTIVSLRYKVSFCFAESMDEREMHRRARSLKGEWGKPLDASWGQGGWRSRSRSKSPFTSHNPCLQGIWWNGKEDTLASLTVWVNAYLGVNTILSAFMFRRTGSVLNSMKTFRKQYENSIK